MRIFTGFLILLCSVFLFLLPITESIYDFRTDIRNEPHSFTTAIGITTGNLTLHKAIYDNDTTTLTITSDSALDSPIFSTYNGTTHLVAFTGLSGNLTRTLDFEYDIIAIEPNGAWDKILDISPFLYYLIAFLFAPAGLVYMFWEKWFH